MKKVLLFLLLISSGAYSQTSTLPASLGTFDVFKNSNVPVTIAMPPGYPIASPKVELWNNGMRLSDTTHVTITGDTIKFTITKAQLNPLLKNSYFFVTMGSPGTYLLGAVINPVIGVGIPTGISRSVTLPSSGVVRVYLNGDASTAIQAANAAQVTLNQAIVARDSTRTLLNASGAVVQSRLKYGTSTQLRANTETISGWELVEGYRSGMLIYDPTDTTTPDDSTMTFVSGTKRFKRPYEYVRPEWFGANPDDALDDYVAIQRSFNLATSKGLEVKFSEGTYLLSKSIKPKLINNSFKLLITGKGRGRTSIKGMPTNVLGGKNLFEFIGSTSQSADIDIRDIDFYATNANRVIYAYNTLGFQLTNLTIVGGDTCGVQIGIGDGNDYGVHINECRFYGVESHNGHNKALIRAYARYPDINKMVSDGSMYAIDLIADQGTITNSTLEGSKRAGIRIKSVGGGGAHIIKGNHIRPYVAFEANGIFNGTLQCILIESISSGSANNIISDNYLFLGPPSDYNQVMNLGTVTGTFIPSPGIWPVTGATSGASALLIGYDSAEKRMVMGNITGGPFLAGETVSQTNSSGTATATISALVVNHTYGLNLIGNAGYNTVANNQIRSSEYAVVSTSDGNIFTGNYIEGVNGYKVNNNAVIVGGLISAPSGKAIERTAGTLIWSNVMIYAGTLSGISPQMDTKMSTATRNALSTQVSGDRYFDTTAGKYTYWNGSVWKYVATE